MEQYKKEFIDFLLASNVLKIGKDFSLKSKRLSPYFINVGDLNDGEKITRLGDAFASTILSLKEPVDTIFGPAYKGIPLSVATSSSLAAKGKNVGYTFDRKEEKDHGEATGGDLQKKVLIGAPIKDGARIAIVEDVFTTGATKYETLDLLNKMAKNLKFPATLIAVDRQEVGVDGKSAIDEFTNKTGIPVLSIVNAAEIYEHLKTKSELNQKDVERIGNYLRVYGTRWARPVLGPISDLEHKIINRDRSVIPACDVQTLEQFEHLVKQTADVEGIGGYKIGFGLGLRHGLSKVVETARKYTNKPLIYDHQKAGTDIPDTGKDFANVMKESGIDTVILFPQAGPETERAWIYHALDQGLNVIVGGRMTHHAYSVSEGGFITDEGALDMYRIAARANINNFVVPGNKPEVIQQIRNVVEEENVHPVFYAPGFIAQGGKIADAAQAAGDRFHGIVGRGIYEAKDIKAAAIEHTSQL
jgi:orotidine-5'-phosphate decarboxylase